MTHPDSLLLETERLFIMPLSYEQLLNYLKLDNSLEESLGLNYYARIIPDELKEALEKEILPHVAKQGKDYFLSTLWTIIDKKKKVMIGDLCFKGKPNEHGEVEIGYGTFSDFQGRGFMTEAVGSIAQWTLNQPRVNSILAETKKENIPSHKTLSKNNFIIYKETGDMFWWRLDKSKI
jgi:[ribosomal protein S5]-alanine N-acetyltransferase